MSMSDTAAPAAAGTGLPDWLRAGYTFETAGRTITEADIVNFAGLSGDYNRLHVDAHYAGQSPFGQRIAHGLLVLSVLSGLSTQSIEYRAMEPYIVALKELRCRFPRPTFPGDTIRGRISVVEIVPARKPGRLECLLRREAIKQDGTVVVEADFRMTLRAQGET